MVHSLNLRSIFVAAVKGALAFVGIVMSYPLAALALSGGGMAGVIGLLVVTIPSTVLMVVLATAGFSFTAVFVKAFGVFSGSRRPSVAYASLTAGLGGSALVTAALVATRGDYWALGTFPVGALAGWVGGKLQIMATEVAGEDV